MQHRTPAALPAALLAPLLAPLLVLLLGQAPLPAQAHDGHDNAPAAAPAQVGAALYPRFRAVQLAGGGLNGHTWPVPRPADHNRPVPGAQPGAGNLARQRLVCPPRAMDTAAQPATPRPSSLPATATVVAGDDSDLLAGALDSARTGRRTVAKQRRPYALAGRCRREPAALGGGPAGVARPPVWPPRPPPAWEGPAV